jgi:tRNA-dihydrouridine synthase
MKTFWSELPKPFTALAPMEDVTDFVFREIISGIAKPDVLFTEFTNTDALNSRGYEHVVNRLKYSENQRPIIAQIWGNNPENFLKSSEIIRDLKFDGIDINMGCPQRKVIKTGSGAALIKNPQLSKEIFLASKQGAGNLPVSIKTRIGYKEPQTEEWISYLLDLKPNALTVHGRTAKEQSNTPANWDEILKAVKIRDIISPETIVIGNGRVSNYPEVLEKKTKYGVNGIMIGIGIFSNPWVFEKIPQEHKTKEYLNLLLKHSKLFSETWGKDKNFEIMKKFFKMYVSSFHNADNLRQELMRCKNYDEVSEAINLFKF